MAVRAQREAARRGSEAAFEVGDLHALARSGRRADVVSAASLLAVQKDREAALSSLLRLRSEDGVLLVVEPTAAMTSAAARSLLPRPEPGKRAWVLHLWAWTRRAGRAVDVARLAPAGQRVERKELLSGLVAAWIVTKG